MKTLKIILYASICIATVLVATIPAVAQTYNIGVYMGYEGVVGTGASDGSDDLWSVRGVPESSSWRSLFNRQINISKEITAMIKQSGQGVAETVNAANIRAVIVPKLVEQVQILYEKYENGRPINIRFILVSQGVTGSFMARYMAGSPDALGLKSIHDDSGRHIANATFAVVATGAPYQGSPLATASFGDVSGYRNVKGVIQDYENTLWDALNTEPLAKDKSFFTVVGDYLKSVVKVEVIRKFVLALGEMINPRIWDGPPFDIPDIGIPQSDLYLDHFSSNYFNFKTDPLLPYKSLINKPEIDFIAGRATQFAYEDNDRTNTGLAPLLRPSSGSLVKKINSLPNPQYYRTVIGAEKVPVPYRIISEVRNTDIDSQNERLTAEFAQGFEYAALLIAENWDRHVDDFFRWTHAQKERARRKRDRWRAGQYAMQNIDKTWATITGAYTFKKVKHWVRVFDPSVCTNNNGGGGPGPIPRQIKGDAIDLRIPRGCDPYRRKYVTSTVRVPLKNEGFLAAPNAVWSAEGSLNDEHNFYYNDTDEGGGYNNLELMRHKRTYTQGPNKKGDLATPMYETYDWLQRRVIR